MIPWAQRFVKAAGRTPKVWGLHNYVDANTLSTTTTRKLLDSIGGNFWFTETGGIVRRANNSTHGVPDRHRPRRQGHALHLPPARRAQPAGAARLPLPLGHRRGRRPAPGTPGFVGPDGQARPALQVLQGEVAARAARR